MVRSACVVLFTVLLLLSPAVLADGDDFLQMARDAEPRALHAALHDYQGKKKFQHGVFEQDLKAIEAIHVEEAADAIRIVELAKRQLIPRNANMTSAIVSLTTDTPPTFTITAKLSPTNTPGKSTGTPEPPPSDTTSTTTSMEAPRKTTSPTKTLGTKQTTTTTADREITPAPSPTTIRSTSFYTTRRTTFITDKNGQTSTSVEVMVVTPTATYVASYPTAVGTSTKASGDASLQNTASGHSAHFHLVVFTITAAVLAGILL